MLIYNQSYIEVISFPIIKYQKNRVEKPLRVIL